jgi:hypothetical protein
VQCLCSANCFEKHISEMFLLVVLGRDEMLLDWVTVVQRPWTYLLSITTASVLRIHRVQPRRKQDFYGSAGGTFLRDYRALPRQRECCLSVSLHAHIYKNTVKR